MNKISSSTYANAGVNLGNNTSAIALDAFARNACAFFIALIFDYCFMTINQSQLAFFKEQFSSNQFIPNSNSSTI